MKQIESAKNQKVKDWKKLHTKKERTKTNTFLIEGEHLVEEALKSPGIVKEILVKDETKIPSDLETGIQCYMLSEDAFSAVTETETPQQIAAVCHMPEEKLATARKVLLIDAVQDPGNLGTMIRTADAAGLDAVVLGDGTADAFNGKTLRSAQGSSLPYSCCEKKPAFICGRIEGRGRKSIRHGAAKRSALPGDPSV